MAEHLDETPVEQPIPAHCVVCGKAFDGDDGWRLTHDEKWAICPLEFPPRGALVGYEALSTMRILAAIACALKGVPLEDGLRARPWEVDLADAV